MTNLVRLTRDSIPAEITRPAPDLLVAGDPVHSTWNLEDRDGLYCGLWQSTPGCWRVNYTEWEYVHIHEGVSILTDTAGNAVTLKAGDSWVIRPGFAGTWQVVETTLKDYVILA
ncbi:cupin domain-containing protein [Paracoccaceae bacterium Fryx2]|nr:cupin domain-containing protein [Paracoccaceae bacterium Fryx2]